MWASSTVRNISHPRREQHRGQSSPRCWATCTCTTCSTYGSSTSSNRSSRAVHPRLVLLEVVNAIWRCAAQLVVDEVVHVDVDRVSLRADLAPAVLEGPTSSRFLVSTEMAGPF